MKYLNLIILLLFLLACQDKKKDEIKYLVSEWQGKEIRFPKDMVFARFATDTVDFTLPKSPHKVLVFVDSIGCTSCKLQLHRWKELIQYTDSITQVTVPFLFFFQSDDKKEIRYLLKKDNFDHPTDAYQNQLPMNNYAPNPMSVKSVYPVPYLQKQNQQRQQNPNL